MGTLRKLMLKVLLPIWRYFPRIFFPRSPQDVAALIGAISVAIGVWQYDVRESETLDISNFSFIAPKIRNFTPIEHSFLRAAPEEPLKFMVGMTFTNEGNLPVSYSGRVLGAFYWDNEAKEIEMPPVVLAGKLQSAFLMHKGSSATSTVMSGHTGRVEMWLESQAAQRDQAFCVIYSIVFEPVLDSRSPEPFEEFDPEDFATAAVYLAVQQPNLPSEGAALSKSQKDKFAKYQDDIRNHCNIKQSEVIGATYKAIDEFDPEEGRAYRDTVELTHPHFFSALDDPPKEDSDDLH